MKIPPALAWTVGVIVAFLALNGLKLVASTVKGYWPALLEQIDLARFEFEHGESPFVRP